MALLTRPLARFLQVESASGIVLLLCTLAALAVANSPWAELYHHFWHLPVSLEIGSFQLGGELGHFFVNDVLMTIFFFVVGLEIKREMVAGELRDPKKAALPVAAALGGMIVPALIFMLLQAGQPGFRGWGIPMATDIAFVVGVMAILGPRVPFGLKILLLSLAIADDIGAVVVIAVFYSSGLNWLALAGVVAGLALTWLLNRLGVRAISVYLLVGVGIWIAFFLSGVHPTMTGVLLGLLTPAREWVARDALVKALNEVSQRLQEEGTTARELAAVAIAARESVSPLERLEAGLHPWVSFVIMPLFALANAGVKVDMNQLANPVALAVALGLLVGKPTGVLLFSGMAVRLGLARFPEGVNRAVLLGGGCLAGIGFTMSIFVAGLAFAGQPELLAAGKVGTLTGSLASAILGSTILLLTLPKGKSEA